MDNGRCVLKVGLNEGCGCWVFSPVLLGTAGELAWERVSRLAQGSSSNALMLRFCLFFCCRAMMTRRGVVRIVLAERVVLSTPPWSWDSASCSCSFASCLESFSFPSRVETRLVDTRPSKRMAWALAWEPKNATNRVARSQSRIDFISLKRRISDLLVKGACYGILDAELFQLPAPEGLTGTVTAFFFESGQSVLELGRASVRGWSRNGAGIGPEWAWFSAIIEPFALPFKGAGLPPVGRSSVAICHSLATGGSAAFQKKRGRI